MPIQDAVEPCEQPWATDTCSQLWHLIEGAEGCAYAVRNKCVAIVVDALRASATAAMVFDAGALEVLAVPEVEDAVAAKDVYPDALLFGERGGLPPEGFDYGNSPLTVSAAAGRRVIFSTTTGAGRLVASWGACAAYMGTTINAGAVAATAARHGRDIVLIPAGLMTDPAFDAQEDWVAATAIAMQAEAAVGIGLDRYKYWRHRIETDGLPGLFRAAPHAEKLRRVGIVEDIDFCAQLDVTTAVPRAVSRTAFGVFMENGFRSAAGADFDVETLSC